MSRIVCHELYVIRTSCINTFTGSCIYFHYILFKDSKVMATAPKKRKYMDSYNEYGFTVVRNSGIEKPQSVICCDI